MWSVIPKEKGRGSNGKKLFSPKFRLADWPKGFAACTLFKICFTFFFYYKLSVIFFNHCELRPEGIKWMDIYCTKLWIEKLNLSSVGQVWLKNAENIVSIITRWKLFLAFLHCYCSQCNNTTSNKYLIAKFLRCVYNRP